MDNRSIGIFDSGVGGLTVVKQILKRLPNEEILYFGDTLRVPYGTKTVDEINEFSSQGMRFLLNHNVKVVIIACNTISAISYDNLKNMTHLPVIEIIEPGVSGAISVAKANIALIATEATIRSKKYRKILETELKKQNKIFNLYEKACPRFVNIVEEGYAQTKLAYESAQSYLAELSLHNIDTVILGCTHFPFMYDTISTIFGSDTTLIDPALELAERLTKTLERANPRQALPNHKFYVTGEIERFNKLLHSTIGKEFNAVKA